MNWEAIKGMGRRSYNPVLSADTMQPMSLKRKHVSPLILGIETSCDDTACALVDGRGVVHASVVSSQLAAHQPYGGVVPEIASREHLANWPTVLDRALTRSRFDLDSVEAVAATRGPGLVGSLLVGLSIGKALARGLERPFFAVHHLEGHLYSPFLKIGGERADQPPENFVALVVSGGHTALYRVESASITTVAETRDDAMGEVFDKVGKKLGLDYPQGPKVDEVAEAAEKLGGPAPTFGVARCSDQSLDFSFSGLKTEALRSLERVLGSDQDTDLGGEPATRPEIAAVLVGFRVSAVAQLVDRLDRLYRQQPFTALAVSGGAAANRLLRRRLLEWAEAKGVDLRLVPLELAGDNAAMIAHAAARRSLRGEAGDSWAVEAQSRVAVGGFVGVVEQVPLA